MVHSALRWALLAVLSGSAWCSHDTLGRTFELKPVSVVNCPGEGETKKYADFHNVSIVRLSNAYLTSFDILMPKPVRTISKAALRMVQCPTGRPCKHFYTMRFNAGACSVIADRFTFWSPVFAGAHPPFFCPLEKRLYRFRNVTIELSNFMTLFRAASATINREALWMVRLDALDEDYNQFCCVNINLKYS